MRVSLRSRAQKSNYLNPTSIPAAMPEEPPSMDTLTVEEALEDAGFTEKQATGVVRALQAAQAHLATRGKLRELGSDLRSELRKTELRLRWQIPLGTAANVTAILALFQFAL
jgi:hypothetical protein